MNTIYILASLLGFIVTILCFVFIVPARRYEKLNGFGKWLHKTVNFKILFVEKVLQAIYIFLTAYIVFQGFLLLFYTESYSGYYYTHQKHYVVEGLMTMILGPIVIRLFYELVMMAILLVRNVIEINNKLKDQNDDPSSNQQEDVTSYYTSYPGSLHGKSFCPNCGAECNNSNFCSICGYKLN